MYARQHTALRCYLRRLLGCFRHSGRSQRPEYRRAFRKTLRLHAVLRIALIHTRQRTALRCYLRRLAPLVRPPQPPKIDFVDNSRASAKCSSENRAGRSLGARRPAVVRDARTRSLRRLLPEYIIRIFAVLRTAQFAAALTRRTATRFTLVCVLRRRRTALSRSP